MMTSGEHTDHNISASPFREGKGDLVREVSRACELAGLRFGIYLSPWERHDERYGEGEAYDDYFVAQLRELLTGYGEIFSVWLDGACGEGKNGRKQIYDWERYYEVVRELQPKACISVCGPDIRWCGNGTFLLNIPPDQRGLIHENDVQRLKAFGASLRENFHHNLLEEAQVEASVQKDGYECAWVREEGYDRWFEATKGDEPVKINVSWSKEQEVHFIVIKENILKSQRIESFEILARVEDGWMKVYEGTVVGYKKIIPFEYLVAKELIVNITDYRVAPTVAFLGVY